MAWMDMAKVARTWRRRRNGLAETAVIAGLVVLVAAWLMRNWLLPFVWPVRFGGVLPTTTRREMLTEMSIVWMFRQELATGSMLSEWNPYWFSGMSWLRFLAYPLYYVVAGVSLWAELSSEATAIGFFLVTLAASGMAMYGFLRHLTHRRLAALVGAVAFMASPFHNHVGVETWIHAAFWVLFPLSLWAIDWALATDLEPRAKISRLLVAGLSLGLYPVVSSEYALIAGPFAVLYLLSYLGIEIAQHKISCRQALWDVLVVGFMAAGIACFIVVPGLVETSWVGIHAKHAGGTTFDDSLVRNYAVTPGLVIYAFAHRLPLPESVMAWMTTDNLPSIVHSFWSVAWYPGVIVMALALAGAARYQRHRVVLVALFGALLARVFCLGPNSVLNPFQYLPVIGRLSPFRGMLVTVTFVSMLVGFGADLVFESLQRTAVHKRLVGRRGAIRHLVSGCAASLLLVLLLLDLAPSSGAYQVTDRYFTHDELAAYDWLNEQPADGRLWEPKALPRDQYLRTVALEHCDRPRYLGYYDNGAPLHTWQQTAWTEPATALALHQVRYVLLDAGDEMHAQIRGDIVAAGYERAFVSGDVEVWHNTGLEQYARFYQRSLLDATEDIYASFRALPVVVDKNVAMVAPVDATSQEWDAFDHVLLTPESRKATLASEPSASAYRLFDTMTLDRLPYSPTSDAQLWPQRLSWDDITVEVQTADAGVLTVAESWYPNWQAYVNGERVPTYRVNWALLGIALEPGMYRVRFHFQRPWYVYASMLASVLTLLAALLCWTRHMSLSLSVPRPTASMEYLQSVRKTRLP